MINNQFQFQRIPELSIKNKRMFERKQVCNARNKINDPVKPITIHKSYKRPISHCKMPEYLFYHDSFARVTYIQLNLIKISKQHMGNSSQNTNCSGCHAPYSLTNKPVLCDGCKQPRCKKCNGHPLLLQANVQSLAISKVCKSCLKTLSSLDFSQPVEIVGSKSDQQRTVIWIHGGGACRAMFHHHAVHMSKHGIRSILMDLPGHGSLMDTPLNITNCINQIKKVRDQYCLKQHPPIVVGGSLGGYVLMELFRNEPEQWAAAIIAMCGQNVGTGRTRIVSLGLWGMGTALSFMSPGKLVDSLVSTAKNVDRNLLAEMLRAGYYFEQGDKQIEILKNCESKEGLSRFKGPILFINGSKDYRDSEQVWLSASSKDSRLILYEGTDHFFSHDSKYIQRFKEDCLQFFNQVFPKKQ